jgi:hypothetical protein
MDALAILSAGDRIGMIRRMQLEVPLGFQRNLGGLHCEEALRRLGAHGFRLATAPEVTPYASLPSTKGVSKGAPLIYAGGNFTCATRTAREGDLFLIRA